MRWVERIHQCGSGERVRLAGDGILLISLTPAQAHRNNGRDAYAGPGQLGTARIGLGTVKAVRMVCDFEGQVEFAIGVRKAKGFSTGSLTDPDRYYVDIRR